MSTFEPGRVSCHSADLGRTAPGGWKTTCPAESLNHGHIMDTIMGYSWDLGGFSGT